jgi:3-hydroxyacyl-[acyl-carrier-protein] dehydratase
MERSEPLRISASHPCLPGHFPGQPVVPGVVILDHVAACLERMQVGRLWRMSSVKFVAPLFPEQDAQLHVRIEEKRVRFRVSRQDEMLASGDGELA